MAAVTQARVGWLRDPRLWLAVYAALLAAVGLWPSPVDEGAHSWLSAISRAVPVVSYSRIEFTANIVLFVPLGVLLAFIVRRRILVLSIALLVTLAIEVSQGLFLERRTPSALDVLANFLGAVFGLLIVELVAYRRSRAE